MKIYKNKNNHITIIYEKDEEPAGVTLVHDRGAKRQTNMFGGVISRFAYHWANVWNNTAHTSCMDTFELNDDDKRYKLVRSKQK